MTATVAGMTRVIVIVRRETDTMIETGIEQVRVMCHSQNAGLCACGWLVWHTSNKEAIGLVAHSICVYVCVCVRVCL